MNDKKINPLALTDDELNKLYKEVLAADFQRGLRVVEKSYVSPSGKGRSSGPKYQLIQEPTRAGDERKIADFYRRPEAEAIALLGQYAAFLIESLQSRNREQDQLIEELKAERERCALIARTVVGDGATETERNVAMLISTAILEDIAHGAVQF